MKMKKRTKEVNNKNFLSSGLIRTQNCKRSLLLNLNIHYQSKYILVSFYLSFVSKSLFLLKSFEKTQDKGLRSVSWIQYLY